MPHLILACPPSPLKDAWTHDRRKIQLVRIDEGEETLFIKWNPADAMVRMSLLTTNIDLILNRHKRALQNYARQTGAEIVKSNLGRFLRDEKGGFYLWDEKRFLHLDWAEIRPKILEIGSGNGSLIIRMARKTPETLYIGTEINGFVLKKALRSAANQQLKNILFLKKEASLLLDFFIPQAALEAIHVHFPDPWIKKRHQKRRLIHARNLASFAKVLKREGTFHFTTDDPSYAEETRKFFDASPYFTRVKETTTASPMIHTKYERKWLAEGKPIHALIYRRTPAMLQEEFTDRLIPSFAVPADTRPVTGKLYKKRSFTLVFKDVYRGRGYDIIDAVVRHGYHTWFVIFIWSEGFLHYSSELNHKFLTHEVKRNIEALLRFS